MSIVPFVNWFSLHLHTKISRFFILFLCFVVNINISRDLGIAFSSSKSSWSTFLLFLPSKSKIITNVKMVLNPSLPGVDHNTSGVKFLKNAEVCSCSLCGHKLLCSPVFLSISTIISFFWATRWLLRCGLEPFTSTPFSALNFLLLVTVTWFVIRSSLECWRLLCTLYVPVLMCAVRKSWYWRNTQSIVNVKFYGINR